MGHFPYSEHLSPRGIQHPLASVWFRVGLCKVRERGQGRRVWACVDAILPAHLPRDPIT